MTHRPTPSPENNGLIELKLTDEQRDSISALSKKNVPHIEGFIENGTLVVTNLNIASTEFKHAWNAFDNDAWVKR
jgi:hypothetical protein